MGIMLTCDFPGCSTRAERELLDFVSVRKKHDCPFTTVTLAGETFQLCEVHVTQLLGLLGRMPDGSNKSRPGRRSWWW
jgi:hypothetical protein